MRTPEHVLVTGAAGMIGRAVLDLLRGEGIGVTALVVDDPGGLDAERVVAGDARDPVCVAGALDGVDAVIHLAALPSPAQGTPEEVFSMNTAATFTVLERAGARGVKVAAIASSYAIGGLTFATQPTMPPYLPVDIGTPLQISDPYALSKQVDEATAAMMARRYAMSVVPLRLPFVGSPQRLSMKAAEYAANPAAGASELWSYLDSRDAARAFLLALRARPPGAHPFYVAAPHTLAPYPTESLLDTHHPAVVRHRQFPGRTTPIDLAPAATLLGFSAMHEWGHPR